MRAGPRTRTFDRIRIVASGTSSEAATATYRELYGPDLYAVSIGSPRSRDQIFDLAIASNHALVPGTVPTATYYTGAKTTVWMPGVFVRPLPRNTASVRAGAVTALIGGTNKAFEFSSDILLSQLLPIANDASTTGMDIVFSRRTPHDLEKALRTSPLGGAVRFVSRNDRDGFLRAVEGAAKFVVTPDSITMICESYATGKPVSVLRLPCFDEETSTFRFFSEVQSFPPERGGELLREASEDVIVKAARDFQMWLHE